jgi:hypothetical protein
MSTTRIVAATAALVAIPAAALIAAGAAEAAPTSLSPTDQQFLSQIHNQGIAVDSPQNVIADAMRVCRLLRGGSTGMQVFHQIVTQTDLTDRQAAAFVADSAQAYCPDATAQVTA